MGRATLAILSTENLLHNLNIIKQQAPSSKIIAMVKANAYGHGLRSVALRLQEHVYSFGVASIDEALALRKAGVKTSITLMEGVFEPNELLIASCEGFQVVFHTMEQFDWLQDLAYLPVPIQAWLKVDTGMNRLGFSMSDAWTYRRLILSNSKVIQPLGCMSHLACADEIDHPLNQVQINNFLKLGEVYQGLKSLCNSAAIFSLPKYHYDVVRPGISLYGVSPFVNRSAQELGLKPVMTLQTRLIAVRVVNSGSTIGYGARYVCSGGSRLIGVIAVGYGDGYPRSARDGTPVLVNGQRCQIVGRVSMDMITIDLTACSEAKVGDQVILWGEGLPLEEVARHTDCIPYEMLTAVQSRVKFYWTGAK